ncbi:hypothetical protein G7054_g15005 [Neopestalotiopsis clavispora]|nr:hypothetical protein G7054_g15005 [Neopestalotiopsis clavispora]
MPFSQYIPHIAAFIASVPGLIGIKGLLQPRELIAQVEFPAPTSAERAAVRRPHPPHVGPQPHRQPAGPGGLSQGRPQAAGLDHDYPQSLPGH